MTEESQVVSRREINKDIWKRWAQGDHLNDRELEYVRDTLETVFEFALLRGESLMVKALAMELSSAKAYIQNRNSSFWKDRKVG